MVRFLRTALTGEKVKADYDTFSVNGFKLGFVPEQQPKILVAALRQGMLRLAGAGGTGPSSTGSGRRRHDRGALRPQGGPDKEVVARIFVAPTTDRDTVMALGRYAIAAYLTVPVYAEFPSLLGRGEMLQPMWDKWAEGDRRGAGRDPRRVGRYLDRPRFARGVPRAHRPLPGQRGHHAGLGDPPVRDRPTPGHPRPRPPVADRPSSAVRSSPRAGATAASTRASTAGFAHLKAACPPFPAGADHRVGGDGAQRPRGPTHRRHRRGGRPRDARMGEQAPEDPP